MPRVFRIHLVCFKGVIRFLPQFLLVGMELRRMRDVVFRVIDEILMAPWLEGKVVNPIFAFGVEIGEFGLLLRFHFGLSF